MYVGSYWVTQLGILISINNRDYIAGLPNFSSYNITKRKKTQIIIKYTIWTQNRLNGHKIYLPTSSIARPSKIFPNRDFWFENMRRLATLYLETSLNVFQLF
jgi:hypothetical protein